MLGWTALGQYSGRKVYSGVAWESVYVAEEARGRGVGQALLRGVDRESEAAGYWTLFAGVMAENAASLALHESVGFRRVGVQRGMGKDGRGSMARRGPARTPQRGRRHRLNVSATDPRHSG